MEVQIRNAGTLDGMPELSLDGLMPLNVSTIVSESVGSVGNDISSSNQFILDEMDSYMEDLNARLIVSRMVSNSVIKGIVSAIEQECAEKVSSKEGIANLIKKSQNHDTVLENCKKITTSMDENLVFSHSTFKASAIRHVKRLRVEVEERIKKLKEEVRGAMRTDLSQADALHVEAGQCRNYSQTEAIHKFDIAEGCVHSLETLLTEMIAYIGAIIPSDKTLICEQGSEKDVQIDNSTVTLQKLITGLQHEYEIKIHDKKTLMNDLKEKCHSKSNELATLQRELDDLHKSFISWEPGSLFPHIGHENSEERNALKWKDQVHRKPVGNNIASHDENSSIEIVKVEEPEKPINVDSPQLMYMTKEELISYFKTEMAKMKRQHDVSLQEKTEELFSLKRELLKEKGSNHLNFKKDKEIELMRKKIAEAVSKLDDIISENENLSAILDDEGLCSFREKIDGIFLENQRLVSLLAAKKKESMPDCSKILDTSNQLPNVFVGLEDVDQLEKLQWDMEALKIEMCNKGAINKSSLKQLSSELRDRIEDMEMETQVDQCIYSFVLREVVRDVISRMNTVLMKCFEEKKSVSENLLENKKELCLEVDNNKILKQQLESSLTLLKMKEKLASDLEVSIMQRSEQFDSICHERDILRDQVIKQEVIIAESKKESDLLKCRLEDKFIEVDQLQAEINKVNQTIKIVSVALHDAQKQKHILLSELVENQAELASQIKNGKEQRKQVELILTSMNIELLKSSGELEHKIVDTMERNASRLKVLSCQCDELLLQAKKFLWYKEVFKRRCEDLQKAETEVDLLADEVDNLISLLGKIYLALEHYSSVLQYYPGVMEILNLIRREIKAWSE